MNEVYASQQCVPLSETPYLPSQDKMGWEAGLGAIPTIIRVTVSKLGIEEVNFFKERAGLMTLLPFTASEKKNSS